MVSLLFPSKNNNTLMTLMKKLLKSNALNTFSLLAGVSWWDGRGSSRPVSGRTRHPDDTQHFPLRRCVRQERHARCAASEGDHQHLEETQDSLADRVPYWPSIERCWEGQGWFALHHCVVIFFWSSGIIDCMLLTFENYFARVLGCVIGLACFITKWLTLS